ncbi:hypothetical protein L3Q82_002390 [Scortum barcoo]|uniref:Uncharacterized protein n=1 Tax=Scortum barcoo TaxID=214431 RepID=A0ACB8W000_9TELE|nr:hypothetical protein L3Q82_002390 [Scortum barcoo]
MAEAAAVPPHRFFCHCCKGEVNPKLPEYICPRCDSGFIEEVTEDSSLLEGGANGIDDTATQFAEVRADLRDFGEKRAGKGGKED